MSVLLAEHRLERCLAAADRVVAMDSGAIAFDGAPRDFLAWAQEPTRALETPAARLFSLAGHRAPAGRRPRCADALAGGRASGSRAPSLGSGGPAGSRPALGPTPPARGALDTPARRFGVRDLWVELSGTRSGTRSQGRRAQVERGERVALMGRNGAGKSTLLRTAAGLVEAGQGQDRGCPDGMALLTQNPGDYLVRERVGDELPGEAGRGRAAGRSGSSTRSTPTPATSPAASGSGWRWRSPWPGGWTARRCPGLVALDEPTRGMDRARKGDLVELIEASPRRGAAVVVATHDVEFAAGFAERVVLLGDGAAIADGAGRARSSPAAGTSRPRSPGSSTCRAWSRPSRAPALLARGGAMSWELASFLILGAVLLAGFAWYERSRPPSQVVALVAALAALAIAGRIAFAAFPNVKPTTDIVVFAGYALGAGARASRSARLTALVSNFWFGQGPWTPWQMAGWGMCGVLGAALAVVGGRNVGRLTLAAVCGFAGVAYGALLNFSLMATYGGDLSLEHFLRRWSREPSPSTPPTRSATSSSP